MHCQISERYVMNGHIRKWKKNTICVEPWGKYVLRYITYNNLYRVIDISILLDW